MRNIASGDGWSPVANPESRNNGLKDGLLDIGVGAEVLSDGTNSKR
ncbi:protein of unknown function (plasmid) [Cupriavidus taiwanensis]|uniref:Uncharacterized protein n=2 Tax=Cupriavidus TaxID=106589 RepID=A0A375GR66_9BURK|nr:hypothetical protein CT19431_P90002 [Cupriavidus taiwanensis]SPD37269.1 protein of unknown function [Cupriavidus taiwanensis]SPD61550.1 protein of unknown function [Cupriavidus taiwanensis]SPD62261.1 protein of unknown function [Cupriavidus neocaledonicus]SPD69380.1 protein of unknown function [Cupriavidus taiwanensis]